MTSWLNVFFKNGRDMVKRRIIRIVKSLIRVPYFGVHIESVYSSIRYKIGLRKLKRSKPIKIQHVSANCGTDYYPLVSVIVPCYNHKQYLKKRLDTIYNQTYKNIEVIILDDCSTDGSRDILLEYVDRYSEITRYEFNDKNVGRVFLQWEKGIALAKGELIWIAESDDWCELNFLETLVKELSDQSVVLAFAPSRFMKNNRVTWSTELYLMDTNLDMLSSWTMTSDQALDRGFANKNIIVNSSSSLFKNPGAVPEAVKEVWKNTRLCGDWIFYLYLAKGKSISYTTETINYYRIHGTSTSLKIQNEIETYYKEQEVVSKFIAKNYNNLDLKVFEKTRDILHKHYLSNDFGDDSSDVDKWYSIQNIKMSL